MTILDAIRDEQLFRNFLEDDRVPLSSWTPWLCFIRALTGIPIHPRRRQLVRDCTGLDITELNPNGYRTVVLLCGRRSGKSRCISLIAAHSAVLGGHETKLASGETGIVAVVSPTRRQSRIIRDYTYSALNCSAMLRNEIAEETRSGFTLKNGLTIEICTGNPNSLRGYTVVEAVIDEACHFYSDDAERQRTDGAVIAALEPSLLTTGGRLIALSTPGGPSGWAYDMWRKHWGVPNSDTLIWRAASFVMNKQLSQEEIDRRVAVDPSRGRAEYYADWRAPVSALLSRSVVDSLINPGISERLPDPFRIGEYVAFADVAGGVPNGDDAALAIAHAEAGVAVLDLLKRYRPPFAPNAVIADMTREMKNYHVHRVIADSYASGFQEQAFINAGVTFTKSPRNKSQLYCEFVPRATSKTVKLLDNETLVKQLTALVRTVHSNGKESVDHPRGQHDDLANAACGALVEVSRNKLRIGAIRPKVHAR